MPVSEPKSGNLCAVYENNSSEILVQPLTENTAIFVSIVVKSVRALSILCTHVPFFPSFIFFATKSVIFAVKKGTFF